jgi:hypothetical protein
MGPAQNSIKFDPLWSQAPSMQFWQDRPARACGPLLLIANQFIPLLAELLFKLVDLLGCVGLLGFES